MMLEMLINDIVEDILLWDRYVTSSSKDEVSFNMLDIKRFNRRNINPAKFNGKEMEFCQA